MKRLLIACLLALVMAAPARAAEVYVYNWTEYIAEETLAAFTEATGITVHYSTYDSNEAMYAKLKMLGAKGYDVVVPSAYFVSKMAREGLLAELDTSKLPNLANIDPGTLDKPFDPGNAYSVPYLWGGTGIMVDASKYDADAVTSWADLWKDEYAGDLLLQDDMREVFAMAQMILGRDINDTDPEGIKAAYEKLVPLMPHVRTFNSDNPKMPYLNGEVGIGMVWNGDGYVAGQERSDLRFVWPEEGGIFWMDNFAIPRNAANKAEAHAFINWMLRADSAAAACEYSGYTTPNLKAMELLPPEMRDSPVVFPPKDVLAKGQFQSDVGQAVLTYEDYWSRLKAGQ